MPSGRSWPGSLTSRVERLASRRCVSRPSSPSRGTLSRHPRRALQRRHLRARRAQLLLFACREGGLGPPSLRGVLTEGTGMLPTDERRIAVALAARISAT